MPRLYLLKEYLQVDRSLEMLFRDLYHFNQVYANGKTTEPALFFAASENQHLDLIKTVRKKPKPLDLSPYPTPLTKACFA